MRILYVSQIVPYPPHGGVLQRGFNLLRELARHHEVHLLAFHHPDELPRGEAVARSREELGRFCADLEYFDLWPKRSPIYRLVGLLTAAVHPQPFSVLAHRNHRLSARLGGLCRGAGAPDVVHLDTLALVPYADRCAGLPMILTHHNIESRLMERRAAFERGTLRRRFVAREAAKLRSLEARAAGRFSANVTVSEADAVALQAICPEAVTAVVPNGVDTEYFTPRRGEETPCLVFTGGMNMFANCDGVDWFLDDIWPRVRDRVPGVRLIVIGQRPSDRLLAEAARDPKVEAPGFVADVRPVVARAAVYVVPLRVGGGTRLKVLDAMAQGKAIVSTSLGAEGLDVQDGRHLVIADTACDFAGRIVRLLEDKDERRRLGDAARARAVEQYSWPRLADRLAQVYAAAVEGQGR